MNELERKEIERIVEDVVEDVVGRYFVWLACALVCGALKLEGGYPNDWKWSWIAVIAMVPVILNLFGKVFKVIYLMIKDYRERGF